MKRSVAWSAGLVAVVSGLCGWRILASNGTEAEYRRQIELAHDDGIPTTWQEFEAFIPPATPEENAAPFYPEFHKLGPAGVTLPMDLTVPGNLQTAKQIVAKHADMYRLIDLAAAKPRCWFNRKWSDGAAVLFPEFAYMKTAARLLALRGSVEAETGDRAGALRNADEIFAIGRQAGEEPTVLANLVRAGIDRTGFDTLAKWRLQHPSEPAYSAAMEKAFGAVPAVNLKREHSGELLTLLWLLDNEKSAEGRKKLGLDKDSIPVAADVMMPALFDAPRARIQLVKDMREYWESYDMAPTQRAPVQLRITADMEQNLRAFPVTEMVLTFLGSPWLGSSMQETRYRESHRLVDYMLLQALRSGKPPAALSGPGYKSPYNGAPLTYRFDGHRIEITVPGSEVDAGNLMDVKIPPDK